MHNKINNQYVNNVQYCCRVPQGTCGLKSSYTHGARTSDGRVPQGTCGLKYPHEAVYINRSTSGPARDLWIEISPFL